MRRLLSPTRATAVAAAALTILALVEGPLQVPLRSFLAQPPPDGYRYTRSEGADLLGGVGRYSVLVPFEREAWIGADGSGRLRVRYGAPAFFGARDRQEWSSQTTARETDEVYGPGGLSVVALDKLPTEPDALRKFLQAQLDDGASHPGELLIAAAGYLRETVPPATLSRALLEVVLTTRGLHIEKVEAGAPALRFSVETGRPRLRFAIVLAADDGRLLQEERVLLESSLDINAEPPVVVGWTRYLDQRIVADLWGP